MAEEHVGPRPAAWTKIFTGFKVALDLKKLLLAAAGILATALGWWILSAAAYKLVSMPDWVTDYAHKAKTDTEKNTSWTDFKARRASWNLLHELAGDGPMALDPGNVATSWEEFEALNELQTSLQLYDKPLKITSKDKDGIVLKVPSGKEYLGTIDNPKAVFKERDQEKTFLVRDLIHEAENQFRLDTATIKITPPASAEELRNYRHEAASLAELENRIRNYEASKRKTYESAIATLREKLLPGEAGPPQKPGGRLRTLPWSEYRGENPFLLISRLITDMSAGFIPIRYTLSSLVELIPVLLEPIVKILTPIVYLFHTRDWYVQIYLILVLLYALAVWGFFGGAITRLAAVQVARNEKIPLREAVLFAKDRFVSFFAAPAFPLLLLGILVFCLWVFGWVEGFLPIFGDIIVAGLLWPIVLVVGLIMAVVLVGLVGWPLMNATISTEGSDSFDALSRSYSYVYQAPWHYLWYGLVATAYGIVLVFFVGFMASLLVYLGKWGASAPGISSADPKRDREPTYLFIYAPKSMGWRNLLIHNSQFAVAERKVTPSGVITDEYRLKAEYLNEMSWYNYTGAVLVAIWIGAFFLLVVGFGYSYFWTAATIIYFLMRRQVDDTDLDEVHLEEDEALDPFARRLRRRLCRRSRRPRRTRSACRWSKRRRCARASRRRRRRQWCRRQLCRRRP